MKKYELKPKEENKINEKKNEILDYLKEMIIKLKNLIIEFSKRVVLGLYLFNLDMQYKQDLRYLKMKYINKIKYENLVLIEKELKYDSFSLFNYQPPGFSNKQRRKKKHELVEIVCNNIGPKTLERYLEIYVNKKEALQFKMELDKLNEKYNKKEDELRRKVLGNVKTSSKDDYDNFVQYLIEYLINTHYTNKIPKNESEFQTIIDSFLFGVKSKDDLLKNVKIYKEFTFPEGDRIDFIIEKDNFKIGIEVKYKLGRGEMKRLLGQIEVYSKYLDTIIIFIYLESDYSIIKQILEKKETIPSKLIVINGVEIYD